MASNPPLVTMPGMKSDPDSAVAGSDPKDIAAGSDVKPAAQVAPVTPPAVDPNKTMPDKEAAKMYYSRLDGNTFIFPWGKTARFENGQYETDIPEEIVELEKLCAAYRAGKQFEIADYQLPVARSQAIVMREVGGGGGRGGVVTSGQLGGMTNQR